MHPDFNPRYNSKQALPLEEHIVSELTKDVERFLVQDGHLQPDPNLLNTYSQLLDIHLRTALTWALCEPFLEQIRSIDIPLSDIDRYLAIVRRLRSLSSINFINDLAMDRQLTSISEYAQIDFGRARLIEGLKAKAIDSMIQFTEKATRLHRSQLRQVDFQSQGAISFQTKRPTLIMERISRALPPLDWPRVLDESNWVQLAKHTDSTCLDRVTRIFTPFGLQWRADLAKVGPIWTECRSLEALEVRFYPTPVSFRWAEEKHTRQQEGLNPKQNLPPLRHITIREYNDTPLLYIDDLAVAFSDTLETINYDCYSGNMGHHDGPNSRFATTRVTLTAGHQWVTMPALKNLTIATSKHDLVLDPALLCRCPAMQSHETVQPTMGL